MTASDTLRRAAALMRERAEYTPDSEHIVSWHPAVTLAVVDWLNEAADHLAIDATDHTDVCPTALEGPDCSVLGQALAVALAYLGEEGTP